MARTEGGLVAGMQAGGLVVYKGIPFAAPPVGMLRWRPPQTAASWSGVRQAARFGPACPQVLVSPTQLSPLGRTDEDCLSLNIWAPAKAFAKPVLLWLHGGGFIAGSGSESEYDGSALAKRGLVVVTCNYRLGRLGFFAHPALDRIYPDEPHGDYGLMDQVAALRWIQHNIAGFGGNPANVTIAGESAGGISVQALMTSPPAKGLFAHAIVESGTVAALRTSKLSTGKSEADDSAEARGQAWARTQGVSGIDAAAAVALLALPASRVALPTPSLTQVMQLLADVRLIVDGRILPQPPDAAFAGGPPSRIPVLLGTNGLDASVLSFGPHPSLVPISPPLQGHLAQLDTARRSVVLRVYRQAGGSDEAAAALMTSDLFMGAPALRLATEISANAPAYLYRFDAAPVFGSTLPGAPHGTELFYVFGTLDRLEALGARIGPADRALSECMLKYWSSFASTGTPQAAGCARWSHFGSASPSVMSLDREHMGMIPLPRLDEVRALAGPADIMPQLGH